MLSHHGPSEFSEPITYHDLTIFGCALYFLTCRFAVVSIPFLLYTTCPYHRTITESTVWFATFLQRWDDNRLSFFHRPFLSYAVEEILLLCRINSRFLIVFSTVCLFWGS